MRKVFVLILAVLLVATCPLYAYAEDVTDPAAETETVVEETAVEDTEAPTEAEETTVEEVTTEDATEAETEQDEIAALLDVATPEEIEKIKEYILYGTTIIPLPEKLTMFIVDNVTYLSFIFFGILFIAAVILYRCDRRKQADDNRTINENTIEALERTQESISNDAARAETAFLKIDERIAEFEKSEEARQADLNARINENIAAVLDKAEKTVSAAVDALKQDANSKTASAEALVLVCDAIKFLTDHAKSIPEWDRDHLTDIFEAAKAKIEEVSGHEETDKK